MDIRKCCYELYKLDWIDNHINAEMQRSNIEAYFTIIGEENINPDEYTYLDYISEFGFNGEIYASYNEFIENEYQDSQYMREIIDNNETYTIYLVDVIKESMNL